MFLPVILINTFISFFILIFMLYVIVLFFIYYKRYSEKIDYDKLDYTEKLTYLYIIFILLFILIIIFAGLVLGIIRTL